MSLSLPTLPICFCWVSRARFTPSDSRYAAMPDQGKLNAAMYLGEAILQLVWVSRSLTAHPNLSQTEPTRGPKPSLQSQSCKTTFTSFLDLFYLETLQEHTLLAWSYFSKPTQNLLLNLLVESVSNRKSKGRERTNCMSYLPAHSGHYNHIHFGALHMGTLGYIRKTSAGQSTLGH